MIKLTPEETALLKGFPTPEAVLGLYEPVPRINAFCPHLNADRIAELKREIEGSEYADPLPKVETGTKVPSPSEYAQALSTVRRYQLTVKTSWSLMKARQIATVFNLKDQDVDTIEKILKL